MNSILAGIYGTGGHEKVASEGGAEISTLSDLADLITLESGVDGNDLQKVASVHKSVLDDIIAYDRSGRAMAHHEFGQMEKAAAEGDTSALEQFFADVLPEEDPNAELKERIREELARRVK